MNWKTELKGMKEISEDKKVKLEHRKIAKKILKSKKAFLNYKIRGMVGHNKEDIKNVNEAFKKKVENDKQSIIKNPQITKYKKDKLLKELKKYERRKKKELKELIEWSKK